MTKTVAKKSAAKRSSAKAKDAATTDVSKLTEDDIRAMSEDDYMNPVQLEFFRQRLLKIREEVLAREMDVKARLNARETFADPAGLAAHLAQIADVT